MKFTEYKYERPDLESFKNQFQKQLQVFTEATLIEHQIAAIESIDALRSEVDSMYSLASVRHSIDTQDRFYETENNFFDNNYPELNEYINRYYRALLDSKFRTALENKYGSQLFVIADLRLKSFEPAIIDDLKEVNKLDSQYKKIKAQAKIEYRENTYNLSSISPLELSEDRQVRKGASEAKWSFYTKKATEIESIFHKMVQKRHKMALTLGYKNYIELGYANMLRSDYNAEMVANFRKQVQDYIVPIAVKLLKKQAKRIGLEKLNYYDEGFKFPSGNPTPKGSPTWLQEQASTMYAKLSPETDDFFQFMTQKNLMDLVAKDGKQTGGYCTFLNKFKAPFIFSNFNGTAHDITVLTHEAGHAFQCYSTSRNIAMYDYIWPTYEACEIHSMSMEFFTWPWMNLFFKEDTDKFKFAHLSDAILFLPYGVAIDEFQHIVYENPDMTPAERNQAWLDVEQKYLPLRNYEDNQHLKEGRFWQRQSHLFGMPFYYIDYVLAQVCAFQFWKRNKEAPSEAWKDYITLCKAGGSKSFLDLVQLAQLRSPLETGCIAEVITEIENYLDGLDDSEF